ncbi:MAG: nicotinamide riboside transporter PnuC [Phycisphaerales bacterium]|nr:nicotinamide riboside transporter PnuC [Phycisphaerales bacterium]
MESFIGHLLQEVKATQTLEWVAALFGVISVLFAQRNHILLYPSGLISTAVYAYLWSRREAALYAEALLNLYYFVMTLYGWWYWQKGKYKKDQVRISFCTQKDWWTVAAIVLGLWFVFYVLLLQTNSTVPIWDSFVSASACAGMWLLAKRKVENWLLLNLSNLVAIPLFIYKGYYVTTGLTIILFVVAIFGYFHWRKIYAMSKPKIIT